MRILTELGVSVVGREGAGSHAAVDALGVPHAALAGAAEGTLLLLSLETVVETIATEAVAGAAHGVDVRGRGLEAGQGLEAGVGDEDGLAAVRGVHLAADVAGAGTAASRRGDAVGSKVPLLERR